MYKRALSIKNKNIHNLITLTINRSITRKHNVKIENINYYFKILFFGISGHLFNLFFILLTISCFTVPFLCSPSNLISVSAYDEIIIECCLIKTGVEIAKLLIIIRFVGVVVEITMAAFIRRTINVAHTRYHPEKNYFENYLQIV